MTAAQSSSLPLAELCCAPLLGEGPLAAAHAASLAAAFKVLPTGSHHLQALHEGGFLDRARRGQWVHYRVRLERLAALRAALDPPATP